MNVYEDNKSIIIVLEPITETNSFPKNFQHDEKTAKNLTKILLKAITCCHNKGVTHGHLNERHFVNGKMFDFWKFSTVELLEKIPEIGNRPDYRVDYWLLGYNLWKFLTDSR